jgi:hypothetical protein
MESKFHCQKTKDRGEIPFCVLEKMRITDSNLDICKKNSPKSYRKNYLLFWKSFLPILNSMLPPPKCKNRFVLEVDDLGGKRE